MSTTQYWFLIAILTIFLGLFAIGYLTNSSTQIATQQVEQDKLQYQKQVCFSDCIKKAEKKYNNNLYLMAGISVESKRNEFTAQCKTNCGIAN